MRPAAQQKIVDYTLGLSLWGWAVMGIATTWGDWQAILPVRCCLSALQLGIGTLFILRPAAVEQGSLKALLLSLPSFLVSGMVYRLSWPLAAWPLGAKTLFVLATCWVMLSFWSLRGSFAIFPARRAIVRTGTYRLIRHPAYLGELSMTSACVWAAASSWAILGLLALVPLVAVRILQEEALLRHDMDYQRYTGTVRARLLPGIW